MITGTSINIGGTTVALDIPDAYAGGDLPDLSGEDEIEWTETITNEVYRICRLDLGDGWSLYVDYIHGYPASAGVDRGPMEDILYVWWGNNSEGCEWAEYREAWGLDGLDVLTDVDEDYQWPCRVWCEPNYYSGHINAPRAHYARGEDDEILEFPTFSEAKTYVIEYYSAPSGYDEIPACDVLSHGQASADTLIIVAAD